MLDSTLVKAHQQATTGWGSGQKRGSAIRLWSVPEADYTKVHMACDGLGRPIGFLIAPGQSHDILAVRALLEGQQPSAVLADRAYDANSLRRHLDQIGAQAVIPSTRSRKVPIAHDRVVYKLRNRIERCFNRLKHFRRFATRYDRLAKHYLAFIHSVAVMIWMR